MSFSNVVGSVRNSDDSVSNGTNALEVATSKNAKEISKDVLDILEF